MKWVRTYDRMSMMDGALTLDTNKTVDCKTMEKHFKKEIGKLLEFEIGDI